MRHILLIAALLVTLNSNLHAEDEQKNLMFDIKSFEKGLNTKTSDFSLPDNQGDICQNVRFNEEFGSITKRSDLNVYGTADATNPILGMHRMYMKDGTKVLLVNAGDKIYKGTDSSGAFTEILDMTSGNRRWQWLTWHDIAIGCDGYNQPVKYDGSSDSATYLGTCLATDAGSGTGPTGVYTYKISFYTSSYEVLLHVDSNTITMAGNDIDLTMIPIGPDTYGGESVVGRKVYRNKTGAPTVFYLLSNGTIANNYAVTLTDSDADAGLSATTYPSSDATFKPPMGKFVIVHDGRLWFGNASGSTPASPSTVFYSDSESHDIFLDDSYWRIRQNDGDEVTFMKQILGVLTIGKENSISKLYTDGTTSDWALSDPFTFIGCHAPYTAQNYSKGLIFLNNDGLYTFNGQFVQLISDAVTPEINDISSSDFINAWGIYHRNVYYMSYTSDASTSSYNDRILVYDIISDAYSIDLLDVNCFTAFNSGDDWGVLYMGASDVGKVYSQEISDNQIRHKRHKDFLGLWDDMRYIPEVVGGDSDSVVLEIARTETVNELGGNTKLMSASTGTTIDELVGIIDRQDFAGKYVSQVLKISSVSFDKLYWSETIPTGGEVTLRLRTSSAGKENLLLNDCFEFWDNYMSAPNDWHTPTSIKCAASNTSVTYRGDYSVLMNQGATMTQTRIGTDYASKVLVFSAWIKSANTGADVEKVYIELDDEFATNRAYYGVEDNDWRQTYCTLTLNASATRVTAKCAVIGDATAVAYYDQVMMIESDPTVEYVPATANDWTAWSDMFTDPSGTDISGETTNTYLQYLIEMTTSTITLTPNITVRDNYAVRLTYNKEGTAQATNIPMVWRSGWLDFGSAGYDKSLRRLTTEHEGELGSYTILVETLAGDTDTFVVDLTINPESYEERFTTGVLLGRYFRITISKDDVNDFKFKGLRILYDREPIV